jgi:hypothetical protein
LFIIMHICVLCVLRDEEWVRISIDTEKICDFNLSF